MKIVVFIPMLLKLVSNVPIYNDPALVQFGTKPFYKQLTASFAYVYLQLFA